MVNQQEEIFDAVRRLIATAPEAPVRMTEQISNVMATQWVRGTDVGGRARARLSRRGGAPRGGAGSRPVPASARG